MLHVFTLDVPYAAFIPGDDDVFAVVVVVVGDGGGGDCGHPRSAASVLTHAAICE